LASLPFGTGEELRKSLSTLHSVLNGSPDSGSNPVARHVVEPVLGLLELL
jgi:hypothetical protein